MAAEEDRAWRKALKRVPNDMEVTFHEGKQRERSMSERENVMEKKEQPAGCLFEKLSLFDVRWLKAPGVLV